jgi:glutaredoxin 3
MMLRTKEYSMHAEVYTKDHCPYCVRAKHLLEQKGATYTEVSAVEQREQLIERVTKDTGGAPRTVPQIYLDGQYIGGYDDLVAHFKKTDFEADDAA